MKTFTDKILLDILREIKKMNKSMETANRIMLKWKGQDKHHHLKSEKKLDAIKEKKIL